jgi:hypothetical protein
MGWDSASGLSIAFFHHHHSFQDSFCPYPFFHYMQFPTTILTCKGFCAGGTYEPGRRGSSLDKSLVIVDKLLSNFVIHDCMDEILSITSTCVL